MHYERDFDLFTFSDNNFTKSKKPLRSDPTVRSSSPVFNRIWQNEDALKAPIVTSLMSCNGTVLVVKVEMASSLSDTRTVCLHCLTAIARGTNEIRIPMPAENPVNGRPALVKEPQLNRRPSSASHRVNKT